MTKHLEGITELGKATFGAIEVLVSVGIAGSGNHFFLKLMTELSAVGCVTLSAGFRHGAGSGCKFVCKLSLLVSADLAGSGGFTGCRKVIVTNCKSVPYSADGADFRLGTRSCAIDVIT